MLCLPADEDATLKFDPLAFDFGDADGPAEEFACDVPTGEDARRSSDYGLKLDFDAPDRVGRPLDSRQDAGATDDGPTHDAASSDDGGVSYAWWAGEYC